MKSNEIKVNDKVASKIIELAKCFFMDPKNQKEYEEWHLKKYGYLPK